MKGLRLFLVLFTFIAGVLFALPAAAQYNSGYHYQPRYYHPGQVECIRAPCDPYHSPPPVTNCNQGRYQYQPGCYNRRPQYGGYYGQRPQPRYGGYYGYGQSRYNGQYQYQRELDRYNRQYQRELQRYNEWYRNQQRYQGGYQYRPYPPVRPAYGYPRYRGSYRPRAELRISF